MADASLPSLDDRCGRHFSYRDLIEVGSTWAQHRIDNRPQQPATYEAMAALCAAVLDPVYERFGGVVLTHGFASPSLDELIHQRPNPNTTRSRDQHAGCELNGRGKPYCPRLGLAVDLHCPGTGSTAIARWVTEHTPFDRLYFYDDSRPFHVSVGPDQSLQIVLMATAPSDRLIPRRISAAVFTRIPSRH
ncbi:MAG: hypothetical protein ACREDA_05070 [Methylocella sp.]